jgi:hypothetical protein
MVLKRFVDRKRMLKDSEVGERTINEKRYANNDKRDMLENVTRTGKRGYKMGASLKLNLLQELIIFILCQPLK